MRPQSTQKLPARLFCLAGAAMLLLCSGCALQRDDPQKGITLEVAVFEGGYGIEWHKEVARQYEQTHPGIHINLWGDPRVDEKLKPRILRDDPPDIANCSLPVWKLLLANKLYPMDAILDSPAYGQPGTWRDTFVKGTLSDFQYQGKTYAMPTNLSAWVCWYNKKQFREHGWQVPKTWGEFTALCAQIKQAGIAPLAFQGKYPTYAWATLLSLYQRLVPFERWYRIEDIQPGAFLDPEFVHAARLLQDMAQNDFEPGAMAMTHTDAQLDWCNGKAAMVFCGLWLKNEEKGNLPADFEMACFPVPLVEGGQGDPNAIYAGGAENFFAFARAKHPREALDFLKYMVSLEPAHAYVQRLDSLPPLKEVTKGITISPTLQSAVDILQRSDRIYSDRLGSLYLEFTSNSEKEALDALLNARITPEQFAQRLEEAMEQTRRDPEIYKPPTRGVPAE